jgi:hypothetical protein
MEMFTVVVDWRSQSKVFTDNFVLFYLGLFDVNCVIEKRGDCYFILEVDEAGDAIDGSEYDYDGCSSFSNTVDKACAVFG